MPQRCACKPARASRSRRTHRSQSCLSVARDKDGCPPAKEPTTIHRAYESSAFPRFQYHESVSKVWHSVYLRNILLDRYIYVKHKMHLDNILLSGILGAWHWLHSRKKDINAIAASMNGSRERVQSANLGSVLPVNRHTGISRVNTSSRRGNSFFHKFGGESGIRTRGSLLRLSDSSRSPALQASAFDRSAISPLKGAGERKAAQTSTSHSHCTNSKRYIVVVVFDQWIEIRPSPRRYFRAFLRYLFNLSLSGQSRQYCVNRCWSIFLRRQVESPPFQSLHYVGSGDRNFLNFHNFHARLCNTKSVNHGVFTAHGRERSDCTAKPVHILGKAIRLALNFCQSFCGLVEGCSRFLEGSAVSGNLILCHGVSI